MRKLVKVADWRAGLCACNMQTEHTLVLSSYMLHVGGCNENVWARNENKRRCKRIYVAVAWTEEWAGFSRSSSCCYPHTHPENTCRAVHVVQYSSFNYN